MSAPAAEPTQITITVLAVGAQQELVATLNTTSTAVALLGQLPLRLDFHDFNDVQKLARLPQPLTMKGMPPGDDPDSGDVGYYAPTGALVLYYRDVGYWPGIARIGHLSEGAAQILTEERQDFTALLAASG